MLFEYDLAKSRSNKIKHGIDFEEAQALWKDENLLEAPAKLDGEPRFLVIARLGEKHWAAICIYRGVNIRIISVRRARKQEVHHYENDGI